MKIYEQWDDYELDDIFGKEDPTIFSKQFTDFLNMKGIYDEYIYEIKKRKKNPDASLDDISDIIKKSIGYGTQYEDVPDIINSTLAWSSTKKGSSYFSSR